MCEMSNIISTLIFIMLAIFFVILITALFNIISDTEWFYSLKYKITNKTKLRLVEDEVGIFSIQKRIFFVWVNLKTEGDKEIAEKIYHGLVDKKHNRRKFNVIKGDY